MAVEGGWASLRHYMRQYTVSPWDTKVGELRKCVRAAVKKVRSVCKVWMWNFLVLCLPSSPFVASQLSSLARQPGPVYVVQPRCGRVMHPIK